MTQKGFATIFGLCLILVIALVVKGIQEAEANHAREVSNFQTEQALQLAAESGIVEAAEKVRKTPSILPYPNWWDISASKVKVLNTTKTFKQNVTISVEVWGERGIIYTNGKNGKDGVYFMSCASTDSNVWSKKIYRRAYAYVLDNDDMTIRFMELP